MSQRLHVCRICGKKFATLKGVYGHQRIHSGKSNRIEDDIGLQRICGLKKSRVCSVSASSAKETETFDLLRMESSFMTEIERHEVIEAAMNLVMLSQRVNDFASVRNLLPSDDSMDLDQLKPMQGKKLHCVESKLDDFSEMRFRDAVATLPCPLRSKLEKKTHSSCKCDICDKRCSQALGSHQRLHRSIKGQLVRKNEYIEGEKKIVLNPLEAKKIVLNPSSSEVSQEKIVHSAESKLDDFRELLAHSGFEKSSTCGKTRFSALYSPLMSKSQSSYRYKIFGKSCSQALGGHQTLNRSIRGKLARKKEYTEDDNLLSDSLEAKNIVTQPSSIEVSQEEKILQCVEPKLEFQKLLAHSGFNKSNTCSKTRFSAFPSTPEVKKIVSQPSTVKVTVDEKILHCAESKLHDFHELLAYSGSDKSSCCSKTRFSALHSPLRSYRLCGRIFECSQALGGQQSVHKSTNGHKRDYTEDGNSPSGETDS